MNRTAIGVAIVFASLFPSVSRADTLTPTNLHYEFEKEADTQGTVCHVLLLLVGSPAPENVNFKFIEGRGTQKDAPIFMGFSIDVSDSHFENGALSRLTHVPITSASFSSPGFSSVGRLTEAPFADGGIMASTSSPQDSGVFIKAVVVGGFAITFERADDPLPRTYFIKDGPSPEVWDQFASCAEGLLQ